MTKDNEILREPAQVFINRGTKEDPIWEPIGRLTSPIQYPASSIQYPESSNQHQL